MRVIVNDQPQETKAETLADLLQEMGIAHEAAVAAAVDGTVVSRGKWSNHPLKEGAEVLVIRAAQGG
jgi:sulfur carrier protein